MSSNMFLNNLHLFYASTTSFPFSGKVTINYFVKIVLSSNYFKKIEKMI